ncbi:AAA-like domain protein [compost metagenome]
MSKEIGQVVFSSPSSIHVLVRDVDSLEDARNNIQIGKFIKVAEGNNSYVVAVIQNLKAVDFTDLKLRFIIECQPVGILEDGEFARGSTNLPLPSELAYVLDEESLQAIFDSNPEFQMPLGVLSQNKSVNFKINGDKFLSKHIAVVGSTGAGKSCTVAKILQDAVGISYGKNINSKAQKNSHVVIFDLHSEYKSAFNLDESESFGLSALSVDNMQLPYWLMNSEELEAIFIESNEANSHNQVSQFKLAVILNKEFHNPHLKEVTYDTPVYFEIVQVKNYIENLNREMLDKLNGGLPRLVSGRHITDKSEYFTEVHEFAAQANSKDDKVSGGPFNGEFNRFVSRLETKLSDKRLTFLLSSKASDGRSLHSNDFENIVRQFIGYIDRSNVSVIDLSGIPFEVLSLTVSLISRLLFDFSFHYSKVRHDANDLNDVPILLVCEEAHNYIPQSGSAAHSASRKAIERIAKEGRKYGISLMVVSQRPSEVSDTILAQCNNFVALRLTNPTDQKYVERLMPDSNSAISQILPNLAPGECIVVGDAVLMPSIVQLDKPSPEPKSQGIDFYNEWQQLWKEDVSFSKVVGRWRKESEAPQNEVAISKVPHAGPSKVE